MEVKVSSHEGKSTTSGAGSVVGIGVGNFSEMASVTAVQAKVVNIEHMEGLANIVRVRAGEGDLKDASTRDVDELGNRVGGENGTPNESK